MRSGGTMLLKAAHIRHYKSLDDVHVTFSDPITLIVGPNAVGKSNVVDCLMFVRDAVAADLEHAIGKRGGITRVRQYSRTKPFKLSVALEFEQTVEGHSSRGAQYEFTLQSLSEGNYIVEHERAVCWAPAASIDPTGAHEPPSLFLANVGFERDKEGRITTGDSKLERPIRPDQLALGASPFFDALGEPIAAFIRSWRYSSLYPNTLKELTSPDKDTSLSEEGRNWASVIKALRRTQRGKAALERIAEAMRAVLPSFRDVTVHSIGSYLVPRFRFEAGDQTFDFDPGQLSDGTLRIFGMLLALYQVPAPTLLIIEEPEQTVHPGVLGVLADAFGEASETSQIIVTTHSPHFVDHFKAEQLRVATLTKGLTRISTVRKTQVEAVKRQLMTLEEFMLAEGLLPEDA